MKISSGNDIIMGFDYFTVEDAPEDQAVPIDFTPEANDGRLPGHWNTMGHIEGTASATVKLYFRWSQGLAPIAAQILRLAGVDMDAVKGRVTDPTRRDPPDMGMMRSLSMGFQCHVTADRFGGKPVMSEIPSDLTTEKAAQNLLDEEAETQRKAGPKAHKDQCWMCAKTIEEPMRCSRCKQALYCSKDCQLKHWKNPPLSFPSPGLAVKILGHKNTCQAPDSYSLADAMFRYNEGFWVTPGECELIADALSTRDKVKAAIEKLDRRSLAEACALQGEGGEEQLYQTMLSFGEYCRSASDLGGFYVW